MKIIKVVHASTANNLEAEKESFLIHTYNFEMFLTEQETEIIEETKKQFKKILETQYKHKPNSPEALISILIPTVSLILLGAQGLKYFNTEGERQEAFARLAIRRAISNLFQDMIDQLERVEVISLQTARNMYPRTRNLSIGTYTLHPRDSLRLTRLEYYHKNLALEKDDELIILLGQMGAKSLRIMEIDTQEESGGINLDIETVSVNIKGDASLSSKLEKSKDLLVKFEGNSVDINPSLLENSLWFSDDSKLISIFEGRRFNPNRIEEYTLKNTYTETFDFDFDLAARYLVVKSDLKAEYHQISKKERFFHIEFGKSKQTNSNLNHS